MVKINMSGFHKIVANSKTQKTQLYVLFFLKLYMLHKVFFVFDQAPTISRIF